MEVLTENQLVEWEDTSEEIEWEDPPKEPLPPPEVLFSKDYFNGGHLFGGYAREGYWDYPQPHHATFRHIMARKPESVLELGCARGYVLKRLQDVGVPSFGFEVSKHCLLTRACNCIYPQNLCASPWDTDFIAPTEGPRFDLVYSVAVLEHFDEKDIPNIIREMSRVGKRGLHGIDLGEQDDGFDRSHRTLKPLAFWREQFSKYAPNWPVELVNKEDLEKGELPFEVRSGDGKTKLNLGSFSCQFHYGWLNCDLVDLSQFSQAYGYKFQQMDLRQGIPFPTSSVDMVFMSHALEHFDYGAGMSILRELRRIIKPDGIVRIAVPDAGGLIDRYIGEGTSAPWASLNDLDEINDGCATASTPLAKVWSLLNAGHLAGYDRETLCHCLTEAGFKPSVMEFRKSLSVQMLKETTDQFPDISLYVDAVPLLSS